MNKKIINLGGILIGEGQSVKIQSMTNTETCDFDKTLKQVKELFNVGADLVRISVPDEKSLDNFIKIQNKVERPLIADIHFNPNLAIKVLKKGAKAVRINPGNIFSREKIKKIILEAKKQGAVIRIGVNSGSLEKKLLEKYSSPNSVALFESAKNWISFFESLDFYNFKVSIKSSDIVTTIKANRLLKKHSSYPIHLGLTEAGTLIGGIVKTTITMQKLLKENIGDTIRVSLSDDPVYEVIAAKEILKALNLRKGIKIISCPTCSRTNINVIKIARRLEKDFSKVEKNLNVAVMGCVVNGPGEAKEAHIGIAGGKKGEAHIFINGEVIKKVNQNKAYEEFKKYIENIFKKM
jgi:(E)-4-hydroxy-3-methylbut-2-enyl-diphosphate synthase